MNKKYHQYRRTFQARLIGESFSEQRGLAGLGLVKEVPFTCVRYEQRRERARDMWSWGINKVWATSHVGTKRFTSVGAWAGLGRTRIGRFRPFHRRQ